MMKRLYALAFLLAFCSMLHAQTQGNWYTSLFASAARTATATTPAQTNVSWQGLHLIINVSAYTSGTWTPHIQAQDPVSLTWYDLLVGNGITATGTTVLKVRPGIVAVANTSAADALPRTWRVSVVGTLTPIATFSVGGLLLE